MSRRCAFIVWRRRYVSQVLVWPHCMGIGEGTCNYYLPEMFSEVTCFFVMRRLSSDLESGFFWPCAEGVYQ